LASLGLDSELLGWRVVRGSRVCHCHALLDQVGTHFSALRALFHGGAALYDIEGGADSY